MEEPMVDHIHSANKSQEIHRPEKPEGIPRNVLETAELSSSENSTIAQSMKHALQIVTNNILSVARSFSGKKRHIEKSTAPTITVVTQKTLHNPDFQKEMHKIRISGTPIPHTNKKHK